jgi:hypothetical protein
MNLGGVRNTWREKKERSQTEQRKQKFRTKFVRIAICYTLAISHSAKFSRTEKTLWKSVPRALELM